MLGLHLVEAVDGAIAEHPVCSERRATRVPVEQSPAIAPGLHPTCSACLALSLTMMERRR